MNETNSLPFNQIILLDRQGQVKYSCETLVQMQSHKNGTLLSSSPLLESIFPELIQRGIEDKALRYGRLENPIPGLIGTFDFSFKWVDIHDGQFILWNIYDLSELYDGIREAQQQRHEHAISNERLEQISRNDMNNWRRNSR